MKTYSFALSSASLLVMFFALGCNPQEPIAPEETSEPEVVSVDENAQEGTEEENEPPVAAGSDSEEMPVVTNKPKSKTVAFNKTEEVFALMDRACVSCHSEEMSLGGLALDTYEGMMTGGMSGAAIEKGKGTKSNIVSRLKPGVGQMPPGNPLKEEEIALIQAWIDAGAPRT